jgi:hypothetical protein
MKDSGHLPSPDRLSVVTAVLFLMYAMAQMVDLPRQTIALNLFGTETSFTLNFATLVSFLDAILAALGADWLVREHPRLNKQRTTQYIIMPALTAWGLGVILNTLRLSSQWWVLFLLGMVMLVLVYIAEYIIVDLSDFRHIPATVGLIAVSFALFLMLCIAIDSAELRLYLAVPPISIALFLVSLRTLYLRLQGRWCFAWSAGIALAVGQLAVGLHYLPVPPMTFGLLLTGTGYALTGLADGLEEKRRGFGLWFEPSFMFFTLVILAIFLT